MPSFKYFGIETISRLRHIKSCAQEVPGRAHDPTNGMGIEMKWLRKRVCLLHLLPPLLDIFLTKAKESDAARPWDYKRF